MKVVTCKKCGALIHKNTRNVCKSCIDKEDAMVKTIDDFMERFSGDTITFEVLSEGTGLLQDDVIELYKAGRIARYDYKLAIKCAICGVETHKKTRKGQVCLRCAGQIKEEMIRKPVEDTDRVEVKLKNFDRDIFHSKNAEIEDYKAKYGFKRDY